MYPHQFTFIKNKITYLHSSQKYSTFTRKYKKYNTTSKIVLSFQTRQLIVYDDVVIRGGGGWQPDDV